MRITPEVDDVHADLLLKLVSFVWNLRFLAARAKREFGSEHFHQATALAVAGDELFVCDTGREPFTPETDGMSVIFRLVSPPTSVLSNYLPRPLATTELRPRRHEAQSHGRASE